MKKRMRTTIEIISGVKRRMKLFIPAEELQNKVNGKLRIINKHTKVKGFRSGNTPNYILKKKFGKSESCTPSVGHVWTTPIK